MHAIAVVFLYLFATLPFLAMLVWILRRQSDYTRLFVAGLVLQLLPVGLIYFPLGFAGVLLLAYTLVGSHRRSRLLRRSGITHAEVERRWSGEYQANLLALGFALEQKALAWLFLEVASHRGWTVFWHWILPGSGAVWVALLLMLGRERHVLLQRTGR